MEVINPTTGEVHDFDLADDASLRDALHAITVALRYLWRLRDEVEALAVARHKDALDEHKVVRLGDERRSCVLRAVGTIDKAEALRLKSEVEGQLNTLRQLTSSVRVVPEATGARIHQLERMVRLFRADGTPEIGKCTALLKRVHEDPEVQDFAQHIKDSARGVKYQVGEWKGFDE